MPIPELCINCQHHKVISDRHPVDHFNDDDVALVCTLARNQGQDANAKYLSERQEHRIVEGSMRPYALRKLKRPDWCPLVGETSLAA